MNTPLRAAVLLDRDGTIIVERDYLSDPAAVELEAGAAEGLRRLAGAGWVLVVVSNQSGVGRGYFDLAAVNVVNERVAKLLAAEGVTIAGWYVCPHRPDEGCACRKPMPGLAKQAARELGLDLGRSWVIGDKRADLDLAETIGAGGILVTTGQGSPVAEGMQPDTRIICQNLDEASTLLLRQTASSLCPTVSVAPRKAR